MFSPGAKGADKRGYRKARSMPRLFVTVCASELGNTVRKAWNIDIGSVPYARVQPPSQAILPIDRRVEQDLELTSKEYKSV